MPNTRERPAKPVWRSPSTEMVATRPEVTAYSGDNWPLATPPRSR